MTGETLWQDKSLGKGCCTYVAGHLICVEEDSGTVALVEASTAGWTEKSLFKLDPQTTLRSRRGKVWTHPVVVDGRPYLRDPRAPAFGDVLPRGPTSCAPQALGGPVASVLPYPGGARENSLHNHGRSGRRRARHNVL